MTESTPQFDCRTLPLRRSQARGETLTIVVHATLQPGNPVGWRVHADTDVRAEGASVWLTRAGCLDDYWLRPGDVVRLARGERVWLSAEGEAPLQVTLTSQCSERRRLLRRWLDRIHAWFSAGAPPLGA